jgi:HEAT repeat protein
MRFATLAGACHAGYIGRVKRGEDIPMSTLRIPLFALLGALALGVTAPEASAQGAKPKTHAKAKDGKKVDAAKIKAELESGDSARMITALDELIEAGQGGANATPHVIALLKRGASSEVLVKALEAAGASKQSSASAAVAPYVKHRVADVRHAAAKALIKTHGADAVKALRGGLRSSDAQVRGISATGLGALGAKDSLGDLYTALAHNVGEAAASIGQLCDAKGCEKFAELTGKHPFDVMSSGFDQILFRPEKDMPEDEKIRVVGRLRELGTKEAGKYLADVKGRWPKDWSKRVKQAIDSAVRATGGGEGED